MSEIYFFGDVDKNKHGNVGSQYPAWMHESHIAELKSTIEDKERRLANGHVPMESIPYVREEARKERERLEQIETSKPKLTSEQKDRVAKAYKGLGSEIADSMFTSSEMQHGFADAHEEARRMVNPCIKVDPELAKACGVKVVDGKVSRNDASKMFKIMGGYLGERTNVETLRRR